MQNNLSQTSLIDILEEAKVDLINLLTGKDFQTLEIDETIRRLLKSNSGQLLILFVKNNYSFRQFPIVTQGRLQPIIDIIIMRHNKIEIPDDQYFRVLFSLSEEVIKEVSNSLA